MTEEEAKTKWCPHVRFADCGAQNASAVNRSGDFEGNIDCCVASDCMMWRLDEERDENMVFVPCNTGGHCGLAK